MQRPVDRHALHRDPCAADVEQARPSSRADAADDGRAGLRAVLRVSPEEGDAQLRVLCVLVQRVVSVCCGVCNRAAWLFGGRFECELRLGVRGEVGGIFYA